MIISIVTLLLTCRCIFCDVESIYRCSNCNQPVCSVHNEIKGAVLDQTACPTEDPHSKLCKTCADLFRIVSTKGVEVQSCGNIFKACCCCICLRMRGINPFRDWMDDVRASFREYNKVVSPPVPIRIRQGLFDGMIFPHSHPGYADSQRANLARDDDSLPLLPLK